MKKLNQLFTKGEISFFKQKLDDYRRSMNDDSFISNNYIVEIGDYTMGTDCYGDYTLVKVRFPKQFTKEEVEEILEYAFKTLNGFRKAVNVFNARVWYLKKIDELETLLKLIEVYQEL